jgi:hypothetical protein
MRLIHNYYVDFLKSLKKFITNLYGDINYINYNGENINTAGGFKNFEFNYASKSLLHYKLYKQINFEYPVCLINVNDIQQSDNSHASRFNGMIHTETLAQEISFNPNTMQAIYVDFKWVTLQIGIRMNFETSADVLNYFDRLLNLPANFMFYSYKYGSFIDCTSLLEGYTEDEINSFENIYLKMEPTSDKLKYWSFYETEPVFKINNKQKNIINDNNEFYINLDLEVQLKIPTQVNNIYKRNQIVKNIEIVIANTFNIDNPILIDTNEVYIDNKHKLSKVFIMDKNDFDIDNNNDSILDFLFIDQPEEILLKKPKSFTYMKFPKAYKYLLENKLLSIYMCSDVTASSPKLFNIKYGVFNKDKTNMIEAIISDKIEDTQFIIEDSLLDGYIYLCSKNMDDLDSLDNIDSLSNLYKSIDTLSDIRFLIYNI